jgi:hypothetical protein
VVSGGEIFLWEGFFNKDFQWFVAGCEAAYKAFDP